MIPVWRVILEQVDAITGIDTFDGQTGLAGSEWDCYFFDAVTGEEYADTPITDEPPPSRGRHTTS
ncbi:MAG: hypothetical protein HFF98_04540 [Oscillibacter sp.]|nr:hypothetical protein [Oscillibacter sp.]